MHMLIRIQQRLLRSRTRGPSSATWSKFNSRLSPNLSIRTLIRIWKTTRTIRDTRHSSTSWGIVLRRLRCKPEDYKATRWCWIPWRSPLCITLGNLWSRKWLTLITRVTSSPGIKVKKKRVVSFIKNIAMDSKPIARERYHSLRWTLPAWTVSITRARPSIKMTLSYLVVIRLIIFKNLAVTE
jgi:hypothetical protein